MKNRLFLAFALILSTTTIYARGKSADTAKGGVLVFARSGDSVSLDPGR